MGNRGSKQSNSSYHRSNRTNNYLTKYITSQHKSKQDVYVIGCDSHKQFDFCKNDQNTYIKDTITNIHCGHNFNIYQTQNNQFFSAGDNHVGECGAKDPQYHPQHHLMEIKYFKTDNIKIKHIYTSCVSSNTFWIASDAKVYGNGINEYYQLGLGHSQNKSTPTYIPSLKNVIDIKSSFHHCIAICNNKTKSISIIDAWCNQLKIQIPLDIVKLIGIFCGCYEIYSTGIGSNGHGGATIKEWKKISVFKNEIIKIECGAHHTLWLESNGTVWSTGANISGVLGFGHCGNVESFKKPIPYFVKRKIIVVDIKCGTNINLVLDMNGQVYCWGIYGNSLYGYRSNDYVRGYNKDANINEPQWMQSLVECNIVEIKCGGSHFYARGDDDRHFLWGKNNYNECLTYDGNEVVHEPFCINLVILSRLNGATIKGVYLGQCNTNLIVVKEQ